MYVASPLLCKTWQTVFQNVDPALFSCTHINLSTDFFTDHNEPNNLVLRHTCGYPLLKTWHPDFEPICVPVFDVQGCDLDGQYSSVIISRNENMKALPMFRGSVATINDWHSNSGMNALRYAVSTLHRDSRFFAQVTQSGSHANSVNAIQSGSADLAAIDAVTWQLLKHQNPKLEHEVNVVHQTPMVMGLPFIAHVKQKLDKSAITSGLNEALFRAQKNHRVDPILSGFKTVAFSDYASIQTLEDDAIERGYPSLA